MIRYLRCNLRKYFYFLILLSLLPGFLLAAFLLSSKAHYDLLVVLIIGIFALNISWIGVERLIFGRVKELIVLSKCLAAGDLSVRSGQTEPMGLLGELTQAFDQMAASLDNKNKQIQMRANQVAALSELARGFAIEQDISTLIELVLEKIMTLLDTSLAAMALYDLAMDDLVITAAKGLHLPIGMRFKMGEGPIGRAAQTRQPVIIEDMAQWEGHPSEFSDLLYSTVILIPMVFRGDLVGVLGVAGTTPGHHFNQEEKRLLNLFAEQAASAIKNVFLFEDTHRRLQNMETINEISTSLRVSQKIDDLLTVLLEKTTSIVNAIIGSIWLYDPDDNSLHRIVSNGIPQREFRLKPKEGIIGKVFSSGKPDYLPDCTEKRHTDASTYPQIPPHTAGAFIPIRTTHAVAGVLVLGFQSPFELSEDQKHLLTTIAEIAGNAIHRMQLHEQTVSQLKRISALHQVDLAITSSVDLGHTLQILLDQVIGHLGVDAACALTYNPHKQTLEFAASRGFTTDALRNTHLPIGQGYAGLAAMEKRTIYIPDLKTSKTDFLRSSSSSAEGFVAYYAVPLVVRSQIKGVLEIFHRSRLEGDHEWLEFLEALASQAAIAIENASLYSDAQQLNVELNLAYDSTLEGWSRALDLRDKETEGHTQRVAEITLKLARAIGIGEAEMVHMRWGALLHDIGKMGVPDSILLKPGPLTEEEWDVMQRHPIYAYNLLSPIAYLKPAIDIPYCHHEKWDGSGYPRGLKGKEIPLSARIFAIVDVWDALTSDRPYRKKWTPEEARTYIQEQAGKYFDPHIVGVFLAIIDR